MNRISIAFISLFLSLNTIVVHGEDSLRTNMNHFGEDVIRRFRERVDSMMNVYHIPGLQLAIIHREEIVCSESFGWADRYAGVPVSEKSLFRIASISKPITMVAILKLLEENKLTTEQLVFGAGGILSSEYEIPDNEWVKQITIRHLLDHKSGWTNEPNDPMFWNTSMTQQQVIQQLLTTRPPKNEPGTQTSYSNFGYCLLGRVIEKISGMTYEAYVRQEILLPCGITEMTIAGDTFEDRQPNEVAYFSQERTTAYQMAVRRMDSHGGWIASAVDLMRLLMHIDRNTKVKDLITEQSMTGSYLAFHTWVHTGSLPGTSTILVRKDNEWGYAVLVNTRTFPIDNIFNDIQFIMNDVFIYTKQD